ncbi:MAG TPA: GNAT family protein [Pyrinomonadaceae bacterium]|nr:GNAT family protein [Pyrinomonadaceae bacterium]
MDISPTTLEGQYVRLDPLRADHADALVAAAADGELWNSPVTVVPSRDTVNEYLHAALEPQSLGSELAFVIVQKKPANGASDRIVGTTRFYEIRPLDRGVAIGYTWLSVSVQRTPINTETKLLLLTHAFEHWKCIRVELITDLLNRQSRAAILRLGAKEEGILRNHLIMPNGRIRDSVCFSIIDAEWPEVKAGLMQKLAR